MLVTDLLEIVIFVLVIGIVVCVGILGYLTYSKSYEYYDRAQLIGNIIVSLIVALAGCILLHWRRS